MGWSYRVHLFCAGYIIAWASPILSQKSSDVVKRALGSTVKKVLSGYSTEYYQWEKAG